MSTPQQDENAALDWLLRELGDPYADPRRRENIALRLLKFAPPGNTGADERLLMEDAIATLSCKLARLRSAEIE